MAHDVFISYSNKDQLIATAICIYLEKNGIKCFAGYRDIPVGGAWSTTIQEAIEACEVMVVLYSGNFNQSNQVDREIELCINLKKAALIFRLSQTPYNRVKQYYLQNINRIDAFPFPERYLDKLAESISQLRNKEPFVDKPQETPSKETTDIIKWNAPSNKLGRFFKHLFIPKSL